MRDTKACPICGLKMRTVNLKNSLHHSVNKTSDYIERTCTKGLNHTLMLFTDALTDQVDFLKLSLDSKYSKFLEIDFINQKCRIACYKAGKPEYIKINKLLTLDFPSLRELKAKINLYVTLS